MNKRQNVILIVDDTPENLRVLGELLEADGHEVRVATNGAHGLEIARSPGVDLLLLDIMMPEMDGYEVCKKLKRDKATKDLPVIFLTALDSPEDEAKGLKLGAVDYITKPFKIELVRTRVANQLALHNARWELRRHNEKLEELVEERSRELAAAHRRLLTIDSAKYDFLQLIYQRLWAPQTGIIELSRKALASLPANAGTELKRRYEISQAELFETINNALLMAGDHAGDKPPTLHPVKIDAVLSDVLGKLRDVAQAHEVELRLDIGQPGLVGADMDLVFQVLATAVHAAVLVARPGSEVSITAARTAEHVLLELALTAAHPEETLASLFHESTRFHASEVGKSLGLAIPLASKIVSALGGRISLDPAGGDSWVLRVGFAPFAKRKGARISL